MENTLKMILQSYGEAEKPNKGNIHRDWVLQWMDVEDMNTLGALYSCLLKNNYTKRITPPLDFQTYNRFFLKYYQRCLLENYIVDDPESYLMSSYEAGRDMTNWILSLQGDYRIDKKELNDAMIDIRNILGLLYVEGDEWLRGCIITAILEHILSNKKIIRYFEG